MLGCLNYIIRFFVLIKRRRGNILGEEKKLLFNSLKRITEDIYNRYSSFLKSFEREYFLDFKLVKSYGNYHFHFLVVKKDYGK